MTSIGFDPVAFVLMERLRTQAERERIDRRARHLRRDPLQNKGVDRVREPSRLPG